MEAERGGSASQAHTEAAKLKVVEEDQDITPAKEDENAAETEEKLAAETDSEVDEDSQAGA